MARATFPSTTLWGPSMRFTSPRTTPTAPSPATSTGRLLFLAWLSVAPSCVLAGGLDTAAYPPLHYEGFTHALHPVHFIILSLVIVSTVCAYALGVYAFTRRRLSMPWTFALVIWTALIAVGMGTWASTYLNTRTVVYDDTELLLGATTVLAMDRLTTVFQAGKATIISSTESALDGFRGVSSAYPLSPLYYLTLSAVMGTEINQAMFKGMTGVLNVYIGLQEGIAGVALGCHPTQGTTVDHLFASPKSGIRVACREEDTPDPHMRWYFNTTCSRIASQAGACGARPSSSDGVSYTYTDYCPRACGTKMPDFTPKGCSGIAPSDTRLVMFEPPPINVIEAQTRAEHGLFATGDNTTYLGVSYPYNLAHLAWYRARATAPLDRVELMWSMGEDHAFEGGGPGVLVEPVLPGVGGLTLSAQLWMHGYRLGGFGVDFSLLRLCDMAFPAELRPTSGSEAFALVRDGVVIAGTPWSGQSPEQHIHTTDAASTTGISATEVTQTAADRVRLQQQAEAASSHGDDTTPVCGDLQGAARNVSHLPDACPLRCVYDGLLDRLERAAPAGVLSATPTDRERDLFNWYLTVPQVDSMVVFQHCGRFVMATTTHKEGLDVAVVVILPYGDVMADADRASILALLHGVLVSMTCGVLLYLWVNSTLRPMGFLEAAMEHVAHMKFDPPSSEESEILEVAAMQAAFQKMLQNLKGCRQYLPQSILYSLPDADGAPGGVDVGHAGGRGGEDLANDNITPGDIEMNGATRRSSTLGGGGGGGGGAAAGVAGVSSADGDAPGDRTAPMTAGGGIGAHGAGGTRGTPGANGSTFLPRPLLAGTTMRCTALSVLAVNIRNFRLLVRDIGRAGQRLAADEPDARASLISLHASYLEVVLAQLKHDHGILDEFSGDRVLCAFNSLIPCRDHARRAAHCGFSLVQTFVNGATVAAAAPQRHRPRLDVHTAVHKTTALCGTIGCSELKKFTIVGDAARNVFGMLALGRVWAAECLVDDGVLEDIVADCAYRRLALISLPTGGALMLQNIEDLVLNDATSSAPPESDLGAAWVFDPAAATGSQIAGSTGTPVETSDDDTSSAKPRRRIQRTAESFADYNIAIDSVYRGAYDQAAAALARCTLGHRYSHPLRHWVEYCRARHPHAPPEAVPLFWCPRPHEEVPMEFPQLTMYHTEAHVD